MCQPIKLAAVILCVGLPASIACAQQFVEESSTRFPQPDPNDYTNQLTIGDLDADGDLDIIFANGGGFSSASTPQRVRIMINDGAGVFTEESATRIGSHTGNYRGAELGDIDGDGDLDMILASDFNRQPRLFVNDGSGVFTDATAAQLPAITLSATRAQFADIDLDGDLDLYINNGGTVSRFGTGQAQLFVNDGTGVFTNETATRLPAAPQTEPMDVIFGDINNDGYPDIRTASTSAGQSRLLMNDGAGNFTFFSIPSDANAYSYDFGDIDNDGDLDLLGANANPAGNNSEFLLLNDGWGTFTNASANISPNPSVDDNDSKFIDYDMDGDLDLIVARLGGSAERIYSNNGSGLFTQVNGLITSVGDSSLDIMVADLNGDNRPDIVTAQGESGSFRNRIYMNTGPQDTIAPRIINPNEFPLGAPGPYVIAVRVEDEITSDRGPFLSSVYLTVTVGNDPSFDIPMSWVANDGYAGVITIPPTPCAQVVRYQPHAIDQAGNLGDGPSYFIYTPGISVPGDIDLSGAVDIDDLNQILSNFNATVGIGSPFDLANDDGIVDIDDLNVILANFGAVCS